jgi:prolipoprotein diacylglyceryltransferase
MVSGEIYGSITNLPWAFSFFNAYRHPVQIYDNVFIVLTGFTLIYLFPKIGIKLPAGGLFLILIAALAVNQILTIPFRADPGITIISGFRLQQIFAWVILVISLFVLGNLQKPIKSRQEQFK